MLIYTFKRNNEDYVLNGDPNMCLCMTHTRLTLGLPVNVVSFRLKVSLEPVEGFIRLGIRKGYYLMLVDDTPLYVITSRWLQRNFTNVSEAWVKVTDINYANT